MVMTGANTKRGMAMGFLTVAVLSAGMMVEEQAARLSTHPSMLYLRAGYNIVTGDVDSAVALARRAAVEESRNKSKS
jgi:hypothetical protein